MLRKILNAAAGRAIDQLQETPVTTDNLYEKNKQGARITTLTGVMVNLTTNNWEDKHGKVVRKVQTPSWRE